MGTEVVTYVEPIQAGGPNQTPPDAPKNPTTGENAVPAPVVSKVSERSIVKKGTFKQVVDCLESYKAAGITTYVFLYSTNYIIVCLMFFK